MGLDVQVRTPEKGVGGAKVRLVGGYVCQGRRECGGAGRLRGREC
jgi:hypothetical protein